MNRRDPLRVNDYLGHILEAIDNVNEQDGQGLSARNQSGQAEGNDGLCSTG